MLSASARTHAGRVRDHNEDAAVCRPEHGLFAVVDGMGGQEAGEVAAAIAAAAIAEVPNHRRLPSETVLAASFREARSRILRQGQTDIAHANMGAVATAIRLDDNGRGFGLAHVGDARAWKVGAGGIRQLTHDHVEQLGEGKPKVARDLGRADMSGEWVETGHYTLARGELLVVATDGLHDAVPEAELAEELTRLWREDAHADAVTARLIALALARGGPDNVTVIAVRAGHWGRGQNRRRFGFAVSVALFVLLVGLAVIARLQPTREVAIVATLPDLVAVSTEITDPAEIPITAGQLTTLAPGTILTLRGVRLAGPDWSVEVGEGATLELTRAVVELDSGFSVHLAKGAALKVGDARIQAAAMRISGEPGSHAVLWHVALVTADADGLVKEGAVEMSEIDLRHTDENGIPFAEPTEKPPEEPPPR